MTTTPPGGSATAPPPPPPPPPPSSDGPRVPWEEMRELGRIRRSLTDRKIAGVGGGIARHLDIDPLVVRVALVVLVLFGGGGILLYGVAWLIVPDDSGDAVVRMDDRSRSVALAVVGVLTALSLVGEMFGGTHFPWPLPVVGVIVIVVLLGRQRRRSWHDGYQVPVPPPTATGTDGATYAGYQPPSPAPRRDPRRRGPILFGLAFTVALLALGVLATIDLAGADLPPSAYPAAVLATCGAFLVLGAFWGRAGGLILVGLLAAFATLVTSVADGFDIGQTDAKPDSAAELHDHYHRDIGQVVVDLTDITDPDALDGRTLDVDASVGQLTVIVPDEGLDVAVRATIGAGGETVLFGDRVSGSADRSYDGGSGADTPQLTIHADLRFGQIQVETEKEAA